MFKLDFQPYNHNQIDCYWNNIVAILTSRNPVYERLVGQVSSRYVMSIPDRKVVDECEYRKRQETGMMIPHVSKWMIDELIKPYLEKVEIPVHPSTDIIAVIKQHLRDGWYCFVRLNRYHLPGCQEFEQSELIHPILVYGYDDAHSVLYLVEDCMSAGELDTLEVSYRHIRDSYASLPVDELSAVGLRPRETLPNAGLALEIVRANLLRQLKSETRDVGDEKILMGLDVLPVYRRRFAEAVLYVRRQDINVINRLSTPIFYQQRNQMLCDTLAEEGILSSADRRRFQLEFAELGRAWEYIRLKVYRYFNKSKQLPAEEYVANVDRYLTHIQREPEILQALLEKVDSA